MHRRGGDAAHAFRYPVWMLLADVDRLRELPGPWFSAGARWAPLSLRPGDLPRPAAADGRGVRERINDRLAARGLAPAGRVLVLTQPRSWGWLFNPVSFYLCYGDDAGSRSADVGPFCVMAEITNTPWDEVHTYVLAADTAGPELRFAFPKDFHVSPFLPMDIEYRWRVRLEPDSIEIAMHLHRAGDEIFFAGLYLRAVPVTAAGLRRVAWRYPLQNVRTLARIYGQAARLWWKGAPFHPHPAKLEEAKSS